MSAFVVGLLTGVLSGCGIGGGSLLLLWLTLAQDMPQFTAGGINLLYFLACAPAALVSHLKTVSSTAARSNSACRSAR